MGAAGLNKDTVRHIATMIFGSLKELEFKTVSLNGTLEFTAWEFVSFDLLQG